MEDSKKGYPITIWLSKSIVLDWFGCHQENGCSDTSEKNSSENSRKQTRCNFSASLEEDSSSKRAARVTEQTLDPIDGALWVRLDENAEHYPVLSKAKRPCCSLCRLVSANKHLRVYHHVYSCDQCNVDLCVPCFRPFHTISSVKNMISHVNTVQRNEKWKKWGSNVEWVCHDCWCNCIKAE